MSAAAARRALLAALLVWSAGGCGAAGRLVEREDPFLRAEPEATEVRVHVLNRNFSDARLYAIGLSKRIRLGVVQGKGEAVFSIPWDFSEPLRIEIDLLAGPKCVTRAIEADPGDTFDLQIKPDLGATPGCG